MITLRHAVESLYQISVIENKASSTKRLERLADLCIQELGAREVKDARKEVAIPGIGRDKQWDIAWTHAGKIRLGISLKSLLKNIPGAVPNRADDLMGEMANVQLLSPEIVTGYIMIFDIGAKIPRNGKRWVDIFRSHVEPLSGRSAPAWAAGMVEAIEIVEVDFSRGPHLVTSGNLDGFFDTLARRIFERNPGIEP